MRTLFYSYKFVQYCHSIHILPIICTKCISAVFIIQEGSKRSICWCRSGGHITIKKRQFTNITILWLIFDVCPIRWWWYKISFLSCIWYVVTRSIMYNKRERWVRWKELWLNHHRLYWREEEQADNHQHHQQQQQDALAFQSRYTRR